jgi:hypothetical protein
MRCRSDIHGIHGLPGANGNRNFVQVSFLALPQNDRSAVKAGDLHES